MAGDFCHFAQRLVDKAPAAPGGNKRDLRAAQRVARPAGIRHHASDLNLPTRLDGFQRIPAQSPRSVHTDDFDRG
jgi:hypothetical protein